VFITIILAQSVVSLCSSKDSFISNLTYLVQLSYLGKSQNTKKDKFSHKQHIVLWSLNNIYKTHKFFDTLELEIAMNYYVHSQSVNASFTWDLTNRSVCFWIVFLTEHKVFDILNALADTHRMRSAAAWLPINHNRPSDFLQQSVDTFQFPILVGKINSTVSVHHTPLTDTDFWLKSHLSARFNYLVNFNSYVHFGDSCLQ